MNQAAVKEEILNLSLKYQVLTEETAFIGVIKQADKVIGELKKVVIPTPAPVYAESRYAPGGRGGGPHSMMKKSSAMPQVRARAAATGGAMLSKSSVSSTLGAPQMYGSAMSSAPMMPMMAQPYMAAPARSSNMAYGMP